MLERFRSKFRLTAGEFTSGTSDASVSGVIQCAGGTTWEHGLYRIHTGASGAAASRLVVDAFPEFRERVGACFGMDWLGRQFALDGARGQRDDPELLLFEPGTGQALEIPVPFSRFHDEELVEYTDAALASGFFAGWRSAGGAVDVGFDQCVGYRVPLFLGGRDDVSNLELSDVDVYWTLMGQLVRAAKGVPPGTRIRSVPAQDT